MYVIFANQNSETKLAYAEINKIRNSSSAIYKLKLINHISPHYNQSWKKIDCEQRLF